MFLGNLTIRFGIHNDQLKVYVRDSKTKKEKTNHFLFLEEQLLPDSNRFVLF